MTRITAAICLAFAIFVASLGAQVFYGQTAGAVVATSIDTGQGPHEVYEMDQPVTTTDPVTFAGVTSNQNGIGTTPTAGLSLVNTTDAANGAQQISPAAFWRGEGWDSTAGSSKTVDFYNYVLPVQAAGTPTGVHVWAYSQNGGALASAMTLSIPSNTLAVTNAALTSILIAGSTQATLTIDATTTGAYSSTRMRLVCTGPETLTTLTGGSAGSFLILLHDDSGADCVLDDTDAATANTFSMSGANQDQTSSTGEIYIFIHDGTQWQQIGGSDNL